MASNLRVDTILPSTGTTLGIGTASGTINFLGNSSINTTGVVTAANFKTGSTNVHSGGLALGAGSTIGAVTGVTTYFGDGSGLTNTGAISAIASDGANRVLTSDGDGTATAHSFVTIENNRLSVNRGSGSGSYPLIVRRTDASGIIAEFANNGGYGLLIGQNSATGEAYLRTGTGQPMVFTTNAGSGIANERLRISSEGYVTKPTQPSFHARRTNNASSTSNPLVFQDAHHNNGSHYKTSGSDQGKFVAPVAGVYLFYWCAIKTNAGSVCRLYIKKNGSNIYGQMHLRLQESGTYSNGSIQAILNLAAGDKVHISLEAGSIHGSEYTHFGGYLIH